MIRIQEWPNSDIVPGLVLFHSHSHTHTHTLSPLPSHSPTQLVHRQGRFLRTTSTHSSPWLPRPLPPPTQASSGCLDTGECEMPSVWLRGIVVLCKPGPGTCSLPGAYLPYCLCMIHVRHGHVPQVVRGTRGNRRETTPEAPPGDRTRRDKTRRDADHGPRLTHHLHRSLIWKPPPHFGTYHPPSSPSPNTLHPRSPKKSQGGLIIRSGDAGADRAQIGEFQAG